MGRLGAGRCSRKGSRVYGPRAKAVCSNLLVSGLGMFRVYVGLRVYDDGAN